MHQQMIHTKITHQNTNAKKTFNAICCNTNYLLCCSHLSIYVYHLGVPSANTASAPFTSTAPDESALRVPLAIISIEDHVQKFAAAPLDASHSMPKPGTSPPIGSPSKSLLAQSSSASDLTSAASASNQSITHIQVNSDASFLAVSLSQSFHIYIFKITQQPFKQIKYFAHITEHDSRITDIQFDGVRDLFSGDDVGLLLHTRINTGMNQLLAKKTKTERILKQEPIVQIFCDSAEASTQKKDDDHRRLLVSNIKRTVIVDRKEQKFRPVGKKERDGLYGACFQLWKKQKYIFASRPGRRIWMSDMDTGTVKSTLKFPTMESAPNLKFELLHPFGGSNYLLAWSMEMLVVIDLKKVKVAQVYTEYAPILDVSIHGTYCSILHGRNGDLKVLEYIPPAPKPKPIVVVEEKKPEVAEESKAPLKPLVDDDNESVKSAPGESAADTSSLLSSSLPDSFIPRNPPKVHVTGGVPAKKSPSLLSQSPSTLSPTTRHIRTFSHGSVASSESNTNTTIGDDWDDALIVQPQSLSTDDLTARKKRSKKSKKSKRRRVVDLESAPITAKSSSPITIQPRKMKDIGPKQSSSMISSTLTSTFKKYSTSLTSKSFKSSSMSKSMETIISSNSDTVSNDGSSPTNSVLSSASLKHSLDTREEFMDVRPVAGSVVENVTESADDKSHDDIVPDSDVTSQFLSPPTDIGSTRVDTVFGRAEDVAQTEKSDLEKSGLEQLGADSGSDTKVDDSVDMTRTLEPITSAEEETHENVEELSPVSKSEDEESSIQVSPIEGTLVEAATVAVTSPKTTAVEPPAVTKQDTQESPTTTNQEPTTKHSISPPAAPQKPTLDLSEPSPSTQSQATPTPTTPAKFELLTDNDPLFAQLIDSIPEVMDHKTGFELYNDAEDFSHIEQWMELLIKLIREDRMDQFQNTPKSLKDCISSIVCLWFHEEYTKNAERALEEYLSLLLFYVDLEEFITLMHLLKCKHGEKEVFHFQDGNHILQQEIAQIQQLVEHDAALASHTLKRNSEQHPSLVYRFLPSLFRWSVANAVDLCIAVYPIVDYDDVRELLFSVQPDEYLTYLIKLHQSRPECRYDENFMHHFLTHLIQQMTAAGKDIDELTRYNHHLTDIIQDVVNRETSVNKKVLEQLLLQYELDDQVLNLYKLSGQEEEVIEMFIKAGNARGLSAFMEAHPSKENWVALLALAQEYCSGERIVVGGEGEASIVPKSTPASTSSTMPQSPTSTPITPAYIVDLMCTCMPSAQILQILTENDHLMSESYGPDTYRKICQLAEYENQQSRLNHELLESVDSYMWTQKDMPVNTQIRSILDFMPKHLRKSESSILDHLKHSFGVIHPDATLSSLRTSFDYSPLPSYIEDCATPWGIMVDANHTRCPSCNLSLTSIEAHSRESVVFDCGHAYHKECCAQSQMVCRTCLERNFSSCV